MSTPTVIIEARVQRWAARLLRLGMVLGRATPSSWRRSSLVPTAQAAPLPR